MTRDQSCCKDDPADCFHEWSEALHIVSFSSKQSDSIISVHSEKYALFSVLRGHETLFTHSKFALKHQ